jgi:hypothetical protein
MDLLCLLLRIVRAHCFASSVVTLWGYKNKRLPLRIPTSSRTMSHCLLPSFLAPRERERERGRERERRFLGLRERFFFFPLKPWRNKTELLPRSCRTICRPS